MRCEFGRPDGELLLDQTYDALCDVVLVSFMLQEAIGNYNAELAEMGLDNQFRQCKSIRRVKRGPDHRLTHRHCWDCLCWSTTSHPWSPQTICVS